MKWLALSAAALGLAACATLPGTPTAETLETGEWRRIATEADRARLSGWRSDFIAAREEAIANGYGDDLAALGELGEPDAAQLLGDVPLGAFTCRTIKLGTQGAGTLAFVAYQPFSCRIRVEGDLLGFAKLTGSQRPVGLLFDDDPTRKVFLGTLVLGDEDRAQRYGADPQRDMIGAFQRIGDNRFRLLLPSPYYESRLDIIDLVPES